MNFMKMAFVDLVVFTRNPIIMFVVALVSNFLLMILIDWLLAKSTRFNLIPIKLARRNPLMYCYLCRIQFALDKYRFYITPIRPRQINDNKREKRVYDYVVGNDLLSRIISELTNWRCYLIALLFTLVCNINPVLNKGKVLLNIDNLLNTIGNNGSYQFIVTVLMTYILVAIIVVYDPTNRVARNKANLLYEARIERIISNQIEIADRIEKIITRGTRNIQQVIKHRSTLIKIFAQSLSKYILHVGSDHKITVAMKGAVAADLYAINNWEEIGEIEEITEIADGKLADVLPILAKHNYNLVNYYFFVYDDDVCEMAKMTMNTSLFTRKGIQEVVNRKTEIHKHIRELMAQDISEQKENIERIIAEYGDSVDVLLALGIQNLVRMHNYVRAVDVYRKPDSVLLQIHKNGILSMINKIQ